jgi:hypothetical protein
LTLTLVPRGRGRWAPVVVSFTGRHAPPPITLRPGGLFTLGATIYRIAKVAA